jgi:hypothetical protein
MAPADTLSPPGSASYSSDTLHVGDGTWDFTKEDFLLPNLVGLNFDTMRYNGLSCPPPSPSFLYRPHVRTPRAKKEKDRQY